MSPAGGEPGEGVRLLLDGLAAGLAQVLESMTGSRPEAVWEPAACPLAGSEPDPEAVVLWWQQGFAVSPAPALWVGAAQACWEELGSRTLRSAGLDTIHIADARNTWLEILSQTLAAAARAIGGRLGEETACAEGCEQTPPADGARCFRVDLRYDATVWPVWVQAADWLVERLDGATQPPAPPAEDAGPPDPAPAECVRTAAGNSTMDLLLEVELPVSLSFGRSQVPLKDVLRLTTGSIVELNRGVSEPVDVLVNQRLIARGEVVVIDGNYAVRIQQIVSPQERLRSL